MDKVLIEMMTNELYHHGIRGQRWGKKNGPPYPLDPSDHSEREKKLNNQSSSQGFDAEELSNSKVKIKRNKESYIAKVLSKVSPTIRENQKKFRDYDITDANGKRIGNLSINKDSKESLNIIWIGIKEKERGKGYASSVLDSVIETAKKDGYKEITLEVPGISPDARHIYEKRGFKEVKVISDEDDVWGGLTAMRLDLTEEDKNLRSNEFKHYGHNRNYRNNFV